MSEHHLAPSSFGDPNAQPPIPKHSPKSIGLASPVFETPKPYQASFAEAGSLTRFAEEYSVFNATPGNLREPQGTLCDFIAATATVLSVGHKRLLSAEGFAVDRITHADHYSPNSTACLPLVDSAHRLPSSPDSPDPSSLQKSPSSASFRSKLDPLLIKTPPSSKRFRRGSIAETEPTQVISPPPTTRKGERKLSPKPTMQIEQVFSHSDFHELTQQDIAAFMDNAENMFSYPVSAPAGAQPNYWDSSISTGIEIEFSTTANNLFQPPASSSQRHTETFDWNSDVQLFQDQNAPPSSNQENVQPNSEEDATLDPKLSVSGAAFPCVNGHSIHATYSATNTDTTIMDGNPFGLATNGGDAVDPGLLFSRPQSSAIDADFGALVQADSAEAGMIQSGKGQSTDIHRSRSFRKSKNSTQVCDRASASSPVKGSRRPGLGRSVSDNRGRKPIRRGSLPLLAPAAAKPPISASGLPASKSTGRLSGRISPFKNKQRLTSLASIPETSPHSLPRMSVRLFIDSHGRARTETTVGTGGGLMGRSRSSQELATSRSYCSSGEGEDSDDTDDEPIIIPSRNNSFNASFALPDPRKPVGSIFHSSWRSISDRSNSNSANEGESEAETVINEKPGNVGDATSELRKVVQDRQQRSLRLKSSRSQRLLHTNHRNFPGGIISPTSLTDLSSGLDVYGVRCVCNNTEADADTGFMVQCESCELWLHGQCINISRRTMPNVYICGFCANTPKIVRRRRQDREGNNALGIGTAAYPLASKSFQSFR